MSRTAFLISLWTVLSSAASPSVARLAPSSTQGDSDVPANITCIDSAASKGPVDEGQTEGRDQSQHRNSGITITIEAKGNPTADAKTIQDTCYWVLMEASKRSLKQGDVLSALRSIQALAAKGYADAQTQLGIMYERGNGVDQDYARALKWLQLAADQNNAEAQDRLGDYYHFAENAPPNEAEALRWYRKAAEQGYAPSQIMLGDFYEFGRTVPVDFVAAVHWYRLAADQDVPLAQLKLGDMYASGRGVPRDSATSVRLWHLAADRGDSDAQFALGLSYVRGEGVRRDQSEGVKWLRLSAKQGNARGQIALGNRYRFGEGVRSDAMQAYKWYSIAIASLPDSQDENRALALRDREGVTKSLHPEQIAEAQRLAAACVANKYEGCE